MHIDKKTLLWIYRQALILKTSEIDISNNKTVCSHYASFTPFREDGELEDGEIDDEGIGIEEENKDAAEVIEDKDKEKDKEKEKTKEREEKSHRHSRKRYKKTREKRHSKRRRRDRQKVRCNSTSY